VDVGMSGNVENTIIMPQLLSTVGGI